ncbi:WD40 repeat-like protein [Phellopilus nigrolimitatus]|nr:WD40 repeat-like protein [Phellopilus nigrolimitatus]
MTPKMISNAASSSSNTRGSLGTTNGRMDFVTLGRAPMRFGLGTRRITSTDLQIAEANDELLTADVPEPVGVASDVSLLRGFNATIPSSEKGKSRRRQTRNVDAPHMNLKKLGMNARGLLAEGEEEREHEHESASDDDVVVVKSRKGRRGRRTRESLGASVALGKDELRRQQKEILRDKENIYVRRALMHNEIAEITHKIDALDAIRAQLEADLLKLKEDELELDDELEGVRERVDFEESVTSARRIDQSSRRRKGPAFLPSEHDELPPGVAFLTLPASSQNAPLIALDFSEPYGTLVSAAAEDGSDGDPAPRVWDMLAVEEIGRLRGHSGTVRALQVEEHVCLTGGEDGAVRVWDLRRVGETDAEIVSLADISEEGDEEGSIRANGGVRVEPDGPCARVLEGHSKAVTALYFEENCLVTGAADKTLRQWDLTTGQCVMSMDILWAIAHAPSASVSASGYLPGTASAIGNFAFPMPPRADNSWDMYQDFVGGVQFWGYGLVSGSGDGAVRMWDMRTGQAHRTLLGHTAPATCLQFDQLHVISGSLDKSIRIWDIRTGGIMETIKFDHGVTALQFDSRKIVATSGENGVKIYNRTTRQLSTLLTNGHTRPAERLRYMDRYLATGGMDSTVKIWAL